MTTVPDNHGSTLGTLRALRDWRANGLSVALCLVVAVRGSTYRKPGAIAAVTADGQLHGAISGGCLESDLIAGAQAALRAGAARLVEFDTQGDDDAVFGSGSGCRGHMQVLVLPIAAGSDAGWLALLDAAAERATDLHWALALSGPQLATGWCRGGGTRAAVGQADPAAAQLLDEPLASRWREQEHEGIRYAIVQQRIAPRLLLIGAGPEAPTLLRIARLMGWHTRLIDHRPARLAPLDGLADEAQLARPSEFLVPPASSTQEPEPVFDAVIVMTHVAAQDLDALRALAHREDRFIGLLGPPARRDELLLQLAPSERASIQSRLQAPVGLKLGGHGPEALALSIAAAIQAHWES